MKDTIALKVIGFLEAEVVHEFGVRVKLTGKLGKLKKVCSKGLFTNYVIIFWRVLDHIHSQSYYHHFLAYHICPPNFIGVKYSDI